ncbi:hypothetical protein [uncultured Mucilaginibacter sp.]|uniref:hypothetical protein n=1 Tax=uncultured Mucilaginibacter sp. TaxID=797541 RepID=UPI0025DCC9BD|nr:hypothetical protein [uncultured Mucilaginibacter sp.]
MDDAGKAILNESNRIISKLQLLSVFFGDDIIYRIYLRSQVIHQLFADNPELDINKLQLFHLQYSQSLIDLLVKIKKNNEKSILILLDEIQLNKDLIAKIRESVLTFEQYRLDQQRQALKINTSLRKLFQVLSDDTSEYPFAKNINAFSERYSPDFYDEVSPDLITELEQYTPTDVYKNAYAVIQRKLMGVLCKYEFRSSFVCGLKAGDKIAEVYRLNDTDRYFIYFPAKELFLFCDITKIDQRGAPTELSKKETFIRELTDKNDQLNSSINIIKTTIPAEIKNLLADNYKKLNDINFLQNITDVDVQANILKTMLNTDMM